MPGRRAFLLLAGAALGALFLWLAVRKLDWAAFGAALSHAHPGEIALGVACLLAYYVLKALRWRFLVEPFAKARTRELLPAVLAGLAGNYVFPHVGEIARAVLAGRRLKTPPGALLGSIAIERFFDFLALLVIVVVVLLPLGGHGRRHPRRELFRGDPQRRDPRGRRALRVLDRNLPRDRPAHPHARSRRGSPASRNITCARRASAWARSARRACWCRSSGSRCCSGS